MLLDKKLIEHLDAGSVFKKYIMHDPLGRRQSKTLILSTNVDKKIVRKSELLIAICRQPDDKWQLKTLFLAIVDPRS